MAVTRETFNATLSRIAASLKLEDQQDSTRRGYQGLYDAGICIRNKINLAIERHEANITYLQNQNLLSATQRNLFNYAFFYDYLIQFLQKSILLNPLFNSHLKPFGRSLLTEKLATLVQERSLWEEEKPTAATLSSLEAQIGILPSILGAEESTPKRKMNLLHTMQAAATCTDNNKLIWVYQRLQQCDYDFLREPDNNCFFHFFRQHHTTQTYSTVLDMLKTRMMLNALFALREGRAATFAGVTDNESALLLSSQRKRWLSDSGLTKANEWIHNINTSEGTARERFVNAAISYYQGRFRQLWPNTAVPVPHSQPLLPKALLPFSGTGYVLGRS